jgi:hypothetical protein
MSNTLRIRLAIREFVSGLISAVESEQAQGFLREHRGDIEQLLEMSSGTLEKTASVTREPARYSKQRCAQLLRDLGALETRSLEELVAASGRAVITFPGDRTKRDRSVEHVPSIWSARGLVYPHGGKAGLEPDIDEVCQGRLVTIYNADSKIVTEMRNLQGIPETEALKEYADRSNKKEICYVVTKIDYDDHFLPSLFSRRFLFVLPNRSAGLDWHAVERSDLLGNASREYSTVLTSETGEVRLRRISVEAAYDIVTNIASPSAAETRSMGVAESDGDQIATEYSRQKKVQTELDDRIFELIRPYRVNTDSAYRRELSAEEGCFACVAINALAFVGCYKKKRRRAKYDIEKRILLGRAEMVFRLRSKQGTSMEGTATYRTPQHSPRRSSRRRPLQVYGYLFYAACVLALLVPFVVVWKDLFYLSKGDGLSWLKKHDSKTVSVYLIDEAGDRIESDITDYKDQIKAISCSNRRKPIRDRLEPAQSGLGRAYFKMESSTDANDVCFENGEKVAGSQDRYQVFVVKVRTHAEEPSTGSPGRMAEPAAGSTGSEQKDPENPLTGPRQAAPG